MVENKTTETVDEVKAVETKVKTHFKLVIQDLKLVVSKKILQEESEYFRKLLSNVRDETEMYHFAIHGIESRDFLNLMDILHGKLEMTDENILCVLTISKKLKFHRIFKKCQDFLITDSKLPWGKKWRIAEQYGIRMLKDYLKLLEENAHFTVSADSLRCPICYEIFQGMPQTLRCGHTLCTGCLEQIKKNFVREEQWQNEMRCPICRKLVGKNPGIPNYTLYDVLESMRNELPGDEMHPEDPVVRSEYVVEYPSKVEYPAPEKPFYDKSAIGVAVFSVLTFSTIIYLLSRETAFIELF